MTATDAAALPPNPWWLRRAHLLLLAALLVSVTAGAIEILRVLIAGGGPAPLVGVAVTVVGAVVVRRNWWAGLSIAVIGCAVTAAAGWDPITEWTVAVFTLFAATLRGAPTFLSTAMVAVPLYAIVGFEAQRGLVSADVLAAVAGAIAAGAAGSGLRSQQRYWSALREHAQEAIATREAEARRRVEQERLRIARDLHDVVGHQVAVASMHLGAAEMTVHSDPDGAAHAASEARIALRMVTTETQQILDLLRSPDDAADKSVAGLATVAELVRSYSDIGLRIDAQLPTLPLPAVHPGVELTVYRVVQEALTNAHRYGDGTARVILDVSEHTVEVTITNPTAPTPKRGVGSGFGLVGMRERVAASGGRLDVSDAGGPNFTVHAGFATDGRTRR